MPSKDELILMQYLEQLVGPFSELTEGALKIVSPDQKMSGRRLLALDLVRLMAFLANTDWKVSNEEAELVVRVLDVVYPEHRREFFQKTDLTYRDVKMFLAHFSQDDPQLAFSAETTTAIGIVQKVEDAIGRKEEGSLVLKNLYFRVASAIVTADRQVTPEEIQALSELTEMLFPEGVPDELTESVALESLARSGQESVEDQIRRKAAAEWPDDYRMQEYTIKKQMAAYQVVQSFSAPGVPAHVFQTIKAKALAEWPSDYRMQEHTIKKQVEGFWSVQSFSVPSVPPHIFERIKAKAVAEWPSDYRMQEHTIKKQVSAYLDLQR